MYDFWCEDRNVPGKGMELLGSALVLTLWLNSCGLGPGL